MKRLNLLTLASLGALLLFSSSCGGDEPIEKPQPTPTPTPDPGVVEKKVSDFSLTPEEFELKVKEKQLIKIVFTPEDATNKSELEWSVLNPKIASVSDEGLIEARGAGVTYVVATLGDLKKSCKLTVKPIDYPKLKVQVEQTFITPIQVKFKVTPEDKNLEYFCDAVTKEVFYSERTQGLGGIIGSDKGWWEFTGRKTVKEWKETWFHKGDIIYNSRATPEGIETPEGITEFGAGNTVLEWDTDYIFYMYTLDDNGDQSSEIFIKEFKTPKLVKDENLTFDINIESTTEKSLNATITPSDPNALYFFHFDTKAFWDNRQGYAYAPGLGFEGSLIYEILKRNWDESQYFRKGTIKFRSEESATPENGEIFIEEFFKASTKKERVIFVFGVDRETGATTGITCKEFTLKDDEE